MCSCEGKVGGGAMSAESIWIGPCVCVRWAGWVRDALMPAVIEKVYLSSANCPLCPTFLSYLERHGIGKSK